MIMRGVSNKNRPGFTMMELMIGVAVFSIVMLIILQSFIKVIEYNRKAVMNQGIQDHTEFIFQLMSREIRTAKINYTDYCENFYSNNFGGTVETNQIYGLTTVNAFPALLFENAQNQCVAIFITTEAPSTVKRLKIARCSHNNAAGTCNLPANRKTAFITPGDIEIMNFTLKTTKLYGEDPFVPDRKHPATVNYYLKLRSNIWQPPEIDFTNFITARNGELF